MQSSIKHHTQYHHHLRIKPQFILFNLHCPITSCGLILAVVWEVWDVIVLHPGSSMLAVIGRAMASYYIPAMTPRHTLDQSSPKSMGKMLLLLLIAYPSHHMERQGSKMPLLLSSHYPCLSNGEHVSYYHAA